MIVNGRFGTFEIADDIYDTFKQVANEGRVALRSEFFCQQLGLSPEDLMNKVIENNAAMETSPGLEKILSTSPMSMPPDPWPTSVVAVSDSYDQYRDAQAAKKKPLVIYHGNCADGFSAAWCFWKVQTKWEMLFDFHAGVYSDAPPDVTDRVVYLVDFSYKASVVAEMLTKAKQIWLIDHHKTALEDLAGLSMTASNLYNFTDLERSGAMLAWDFCNNCEFGYNVGQEFIKRIVRPGDPDYQVPPKLLEHVQDRDLWKFKLPLTREIQANLFSYPYEFETWDMLMSANITQLLEMGAAGAAIERKHHKDIAELVKVCQRYMTIGGYTVPVASLPYMLTSDAGHLMAKEYDGGRFFAACYWDTGIHRIFSLRSTENGMDVSVIAKDYGGGGHKNAAGFRVPRDHYLARS
jgi:oligoribonuclease NrnB/cAMP/cGMP phosphodiesterase (DHH superfamily)